MLNMKKWIAALLALCMLLSMAACTPGDEEGSGTTTATGNTNATQKELPRDYDVPADTAIATLPKYTYDGFLSLWDEEEGAHLLRFQTDNADGYKAYQTDLEKAGFEKYAENEIVGNLYATWISDEVSVTTMYVPSLNEVRIVAEPKGALAPREEDNVYEDKGVEPVMAMVGTHYKAGKDNGMCFIFRLADGSFIIEDSGHNAKAQGDAIYNTLRELAPDPDNIVIAAWIFSHFHGDHTGGFYNFTKNHGSEVTVEKFIWNYPTEKTFVMNDSILSQKTNMLTYSAKYEGAQVIEAHPGQVYYIRNMKFEVLSTLELLPWQDIAFFNNTSTVLRMYFGGNVITMMGDCGPNETEVVYNAYGDYLKTDILQVTHHGYVGATAELNSALAPTVALWPVSIDHYTCYRYESYNKPLANAAHTYVAQKLTTVIPLPFNADTVYTWELYAD